MAEKIKLNDRFLTTVSGGYLPDNWQSMADEAIAEFKAYSDEEIAMTGYSHNADGFIAALTDQRNLGNTAETTAEEFARLTDYIRKRY